MSSILESNILPGDSISKNDHEKLKVIFAVVIIVGAAIAYLVYVSKDSYKGIHFGSESRQIDSSVLELKKYEVQLTDEQKFEETRDLSKYSVTSTEEQKAADYAELLKYSNK